MKIFIASSRESIDRLRDIEVWLEEDGHDPLPWDTPGLFPPGDQTLLTLINISKQVDAAIFIFGEDDHIWYRGDAMLQPRDNVLIEYGLFVGVLGSRKSIICRYGNPRNASDLHGITVIDISDKRKARARAELRIWASRLNSSPIDPNLLRLSGQIHELEVENEHLKQKIIFEQAKSNDLEKILQEENLIDFSNIDLTLDGFWKLLFDYNFFEGAATLLAKYGKTPEDIHILLIQCNAENIAKQIAWHADESNPQKNIIMARKVLRVFRGFYTEKDFTKFTKFIHNIPKDLHEEFVYLAHSVIDRRL